VLIFAYIHSFYAFKVDKNQLLKKKDLNLEISEKCCISSGLLSCYVISKRTLNAVKSVDVVEIHLKKTKNGGPILSDTLYFTAI